MTVKLLTEHYLEFLSLKGGCTGSSESTLVKMPHCCQSRITIFSGDAIAIRKMKFTNLDYASAVSVGILCFLGLINVCICAPLDQYFQTDETEINNPQVRKPN